MQDTLSIVLIVHVGSDILPHVPTRSQTIPHPVSQTTFVNMSATRSAYDEESDSKWSTTAVDGSQCAHSVSSRSSFMGELSCTTQNSKATVPAAPPAPQKDIDTAIPLAILMHTAQCHSSHAGLAAGDAPPKEPMHKAQQDEPENIPLTNHTAEDHHHNDNVSTGGDSPALNQRTSSANLRTNSLAPLTALGSLFTPIRSLPTFLTGAKLMNPLEKCALPFWRKGKQLERQQQVQVAGQEQAASSPGVVDDEEQSGSPPPLSASHADPDRGHASERAQSVASPTRACPGSWRSSTPGPDAVPALSSSPVSSESSKSDTKLRPDESADDPARVGVGGVWGGEERRWWRSGGGTDGWESPSQRRRGVCGDSVSGTMHRAKKKDLGLDSSKHGNNSHIISLPQPITPPLSHLPPPPPSPPHPSANDSPFHHTPP